MKVVFAVSEASPFAKTGGLADVAGALPGALKDAGCQVVLFMPLYRDVRESGCELEETGIEVSVPMGRRTITAEVVRGTSEDVPVYFIKRDEFYDRSYLYGTPEGDYFDNLERFVFFNRAVLEALKKRGFKPDVIHCNDWQTALVPAYLRDLYVDDPFFSRTATVFTIHNLAYQGVFPPGLYDLTGLAPALFNPDGLEFWGKINVLKSGIAYSNVVTTVSEAYAQEIQTEEYGCGLEGLLKRRKGDLYGILNGVDYEEWNTEVDKLIPSHYSKDNFRGKAACKRRLIREFGLPIEYKTPVIGVITRLASQKGLDILSEAIPELMELDLAIAVLGTGDRKYQELLKKLAGKYPEKLSVKIAFNNRLAHLVEAGSDMLLMPSRYEPCGLNQIYSLRYGTIPVVRATGGLDDTVDDYQGGRGNGFKFEEYSADALVAKVTEAIMVYRDRRKWRSLKQNAMKEDYSWTRAAGEYMDVYKKAVSKVPKT